MAIPYVKYDWAMEKVQMLPTTGARAMKVFRIEDCDFIAVPQLASDIPDEIPNMTRGNSNVPTIVYKHDGSNWEEFQRLPSPGGEGAEAFEIDGQHFLAIASLRSGNGSSAYQYSISSNIYKFSNGSFELFQAIPTFAAKNWHFFSIHGRHFLALGQGAIVEPEAMPKEVPPSKIFEWDGSQFVDFQTVPSKWGYSWTTFVLEDSFFLAYADHITPSTIYRWSGTGFTAHQELQGVGGRAFCFFTDDKDSYLAFARLTGQTELFRWENSRFQSHQILSGAGGREFALLQEKGQTLLFQINFISGTRDAPTTALQSFIFQLQDGRLVLSESFGTCGATDAAIIRVNGATYLGVSESLAPNASFSTKSCIYKLSSKSKERIDTTHKTYQNPDMLELFHAYTSNPNSCGASLTKLTMSQKSSEPLLVATSTTLALFPGDGRKPAYMPFRFGSRGFEEMAGVSHLGPAMASIVKMRTMDSNSEWRIEAQRMLTATKNARGANSVSLWTDKIQVEAYQGREQKIAAMLDYACALTSRFLETILHDETKCTPKYLQEAYLEGTDGSLGAVLPFNLVMLATFYLTAMEITCRLTRWLHQQRIDWARVEVLVCGKQGRPTSGVVWTANSVCQMILGASDNKLSLERMYIAPHAPVFTISDLDDADTMRRFEESMRFLWCYTRAISELGSVMFDGYPCYSADGYEQPVLTAATKTLQEMPKIQNMTDIYTMITRLRILMEDPRQLLSGCLADLAVQELQRTNTNPQEVLVPGLSGFDYPVGLEDSLLSRPSWSDLKYRDTNARMQHTIHGGELDEQVSNPASRPFTPSYSFLPVSRSGKLAYWTSSVISSPEEQESSPILWLHGLPLSSVSWLPQYNHFKTSTRRQIFVDLRGYGKSSKLPQPASVEDYSVTELYVSDVVELLRHLRVPKAVFIGFASAGHLALRIAAQHSHLVDKLIVLNGSPKFRSSSDWPHGFSTNTIDKFLAPGPLDGRQASIETLTSRVLDPSLVFADISTAKAAETSSLMRQQSLEAGTESLLGFFNNISFDDDRNLLSLIRAPTLIISGCKGKEVSSAVAEYLHRQIDGSKLVELAGGDHFLGLTRPELVNWAIEDFLSF